MSGSPYVVGGVDVGSPRAGDGGRVHERVSITVAGHDWREAARDVQLENTDDDGGSILTFSSKRDLKRFTGREVAVDVDGEPYFRGRLKRPGSEPGSRRVKNAIACGPFADMASQQMNEQKSYSGLYLVQALYDIVGRAFTVSGSFIVVGGDGIQIEEYDVAEETTITESAMGLCEPSNFKLLDNRDGTKAAFKEPRPGSTGDAVATYTPEDYRQGEFDVDPTVDVEYARVVVMRRDDTGYVLREEQPIEGPLGSEQKAYRTWYITDWPGDAASAKQEAFDIGRNLMDEVGFTLTVPLDRAIWRYDQVVGIKEDEDDHGVTWRHRYSLVAGGGISADLSGMMMTLTGKGIWRGSTPVDGPRTGPLVLGSGSPYVVTP